MSADGEERSDAPKLTVVHRSAPDVADGFAARLRSEGVEALVLDRPGFLVLLASFGTYRSRVAVPVEQEAEARRVMAAWDEEASGRVEDLTRQVGRQVLFAALPAAVGVVLVLWKVEGFDRVPWLACVVPAVFLLTFLALSFGQRGGRAS